METTLHNAAGLATATLRLTARAGIGLLLAASGLAYAASPAPVARREPEPRKGAVEPSSRGRAPTGRTMAPERASLLQGLASRRARFAHLDALAERGKSTRIPDPSDSLLGDAGGFRTALADHGIGLVGMSLNNFSYDVLSHPQARPQHFGGQRPTVSDIQQVIVTYDLAKIGIENGQFVFGLVNYQTTWNAIGPRTRISLSRFAYYQSFDQRRWELKLGYNCNDLEFYGAAVGGSLSSGVFGPSATIPYEVGLTHLPQCAPGLNITYNADNHFYNKLGLQRSLSPGGGQMEHALNRYGVRFGLHGAVC